MRYATGPMRIQQGFTLIELMVVVVLMMLVISLVAPMGVNMVEKAKAQTEYIQLQSFFKKRSQQAFLSSQVVYIETSDNSLTYWQRGDQRTVKTFDNLVFSKEISKFSFNRTGLPSLLLLDVQVGNKALTLDLGSLWGNKIG